MRPPELPPRPPPPPPLEFLWPKEDIRLDCNVPPALALGAAAFLGPSEDFRLEALETPEPVDELLLREPLALRLPRALPLEIPPLPLRPKLFAIEGWSTLQGRLRLEAGAFVGALAEALVELVK